MRILLDADTPMQMLDVLRRVLPGHTVHHVHDLNWSNKKDIPLLRDAAKRNYKAFVTNDSSQLDDPEETAAIRRSGMHHIRYSQKRKGLEGLALAVGAVVAAMPSVVSHLELADSQLLIHVKGLDPRNRFDSQDPLKNPPPYWK